MRSTFFNQNFYLNIQKFCDFLATLRETSVKEQEVAISQAIANIIKNKQPQESQGYWRAISLPFTNRKNTIANKLITLFAETSNIYYQAEL